MSIREDYLKARAQAEAQAEAATPPPSEEVAKAWSERTARACRASRVDAARQKILRAEGWYTVDGVPAANGGVHPFDYERRTILGEVVHAGCPAEQLSAGNAAVPPTAVVHVANEQEVA